MARSVTTLLPLEPAAQNGRLDLAVPAQSLTYEIGLNDHLIVQIDQIAGAWTGGQTLNYTGSLNDATYYGLGLFSAVGVRNVFDVFGIKRVQFSIGSPTGTVGANLVQLTVRAYQITLLL